MICEKCRGKGVVKTNPLRDHVTFDIGQRRKTNAKPWVGYVRKCRECGGTGKHETISTREMPGDG